MPGNPTCRFSIGSRLAIATPFHWLSPCASTVKPASSKASYGNCSGLHLISCIASTSMPSRTAKSTVRTTRARIELTFQVAMRMASSVLAPALGSAPRRPAVAYSVSAARGIPLRPVLARCVTTPHRNQTEYGTRTRAAGHSARRMSSTRCLASPKSICVLSRKNSGFCTPA